MQDQTSASGQTAGWGDLFAGKNAIRSLTLVGGVALHAINVFIATTILPTVVADIGGMDYYAWNTALFVTASILGSALVPRLLSQAGPRSAYLLAAVIFAAGTLACGLAPSMPVMLAGRSVQGLGGGMMLALSYAMIRIVSLKISGPAPSVSSPACGALQPSLVRRSAAYSPSLASGALPSGRWHR